MEENYMDVFKTEAQAGNIVYLTSDSPNELENFDDNQVYLIGGLVDHNKHKLLSYNMAMKNNLKHYRLPIDKYLFMKTRKVLAVNHIFEIICNFTVSGDWQNAFMSIIPKRKGAQLGAADDRDDTDDVQTAKLPDKPNEETTSLTLCSDQHHVDVLNHTDI
jgi:tRNA (guanine9-N1)-methyltransferase